MITVEGQKFNNVHVDHPKIREYTKNMLKGGKTVEETSKRVGMPREVIESIKRDIKKVR